MRTFESAKAVCILLIHCLLYRRALSERGSPVDQE